MRFERSRVVLATVLALVATAAAGTAGDGLRKIEANTNAGGLKDQEHHADASASPFLRQKQENRLLANCGDGVCKGNEDANTCPGDCGGTPATPAPTEAPVSGTGGVCSNNNAKQCWGDSHCTVCDKGGNAGASCSDDSDCKPHSCVLGGTCVMPSPSSSPTLGSTNAPTLSPTNNPTDNPSTDSPTTSPTDSPTSSPITSPTGKPTDDPITEDPTTSPTDSPTSSPSSSPTKNPTSSPTAGPTNAPSDSPTSSPVASPTAGPTAGPSDSPTGSPVASPTNGPSDSPSSSPVASPTASPTAGPSDPPTGSLTGSPATAAPTASLTETPTGGPTSDWPALNYIGGDPNTTAIGLLQACEGDCDSYKTCDVGLECFHRSSGSSAHIAGCIGDMTAFPGGDYCRVPIDGVLAEVSNGDRSELGLLGHCRGECDSYKDCQEGLECFFRDQDPKEIVVGCEGDHTQLSGSDYCRVPVPGYVSYLTDEGDRIDDGCLDECQGDCDSDEDCQTHLLCLQRGGYEPVPGCDGPGKSGVDYCYDPTKLNPTASPTESLRPTISSAPTAGPTITRAPTDAGDVPRSGSSRSLSTAGGESVELAKSSPGSLVTLNKIIVSSDSSGTSTPDVLIPLARSYDGHDWESSAGNFATSAPDVHGCHNIFSAGSCMIPLPTLTDSATESYVLSTYEYQLSRKDSIARILEKTTFGTTAANLNDFEASFGGNGALDMETAFAEYVKDQMDNVETTSHREFYRRRTNPRWAYSLSPARSDHPCSPNSQWRRYAFTRKDRYEDDDDINRYLQVSFPTAATESRDFTLYEAEDAAIINGPDAKTSNPGYTGTGYLDYRYTIGEFVEWEVNAPSAGAGDYQLSFYFANSGGLDRPLDIYVNEVLISALSFPYVSGWSSWTYSNMLTVTLNDGTNTIRAVQTTGNGPNIDHLRIGKERPSAVLSIDGQARTVVPELWLPGDRTYTFSASFSYEICNWPFVPTYRYSRGYLAVRLENGECKALSVGNPTIAFPQDLEEYAPSEHRLDLPDPSGGRLTPIIVNTDLDPNYNQLPNQTYYHLDAISADRCDQLPATSELGDTPIFGELPDGTLLLWDPKLKLEDNTEASPLADGGGGVNKATGVQVRCMNAPQTFLNEDTCRMSQDEDDACTASQGAPLTDILLDETNIISLYNLTGRYVYAIKGLLVEQENQAKVDHPCKVSHTSRWEKIPGITSCPLPTGMGNITKATLSHLILDSTDDNPYTTDITFPSDGTCDEFDISGSVAIQIQVGSTCYNHVHPQHLDVYDVTYWTDPKTHPGNKENGIIRVPHPIKKWAESDDKVTYPGWFLIYPSGHPTEPHDMNRWDTRNGLFDYVGRFGDSVAFRDLPNDLRLPQVVAEFSTVSSGGGSAAGGVMVCGSIGEVTNDPLQGSNFDMDTPEIDTSSSSWLHQQRATVWTKVALTAPDQLRQRVAWALSQVLVIVADGIDADSLTEPYVNYYDIFTRNAFGNYRDILGEVSYSPLMAEHLSYLESKSAAYIWDANNRIAFADENFAREVMQLFTIGLYKLNPDGTQVLDSESGEPIQAYSNEDIVSFAKAWTGFKRQASRGNIEDGPDRSRNRLDPMAIESAWRDMFPKSDLTGGYIGDKYPLCVDLPDKMFLSKGAKYRLLGKNPLPKLMEDNPNFANDDLMALYNGLRMGISDGLDNNLYDVLNNDGNYKSTVVLDANLNCVGNECLVDTVRVVKVNDVYFEYIRPPCVELSFFEGGKAINLDRAYNSGRMCANPLLPYASEACLGASDPIMQPATRNYIYLGERMTYALAEARCAAEGKELGTFYSARYNGQEWQTGYHWQDNTCEIYAVVDGAGYVAITHNPFDYTLNGAKHLDEQNLNFFKVFWEGGNYPTVENNCASSACKVLSEGCLCQTEVIESQVFGSDPMDANDILSQLSIGAMDPSSFAEGTFASPESFADFTVHKRNSGSAYDKGTVFEATDSKGRSYFLKNVKSSVRLKGWAYDPTIHEAEDAVSEGATLGTSSYSTGTGYVDLQESITSFVNWTVPAVSQAGDYTIYFRYSLGSTSSSSGPDRPLEITVNDVVVNPSLSFKNTGGWTNWLHTEPLTVTLAAGKNNVIRAKATGMSGADIDHLRIERADAPLNTVYAFRNAPHFMSMIRDADPYGIGEATARDAQYETDAVLDHYFYHDNTAPFLCIRFIQRFGISNPSPRYVAECAHAFQSGSYATSSGHAFGTGSYGDLSAAVASILLDRESSAGVLDKDPASGALREPLLKIISLMKTMEFSADENPILWSMENDIGQQAHEFETVFSFFLPEYTSDLGPTSSASLVAPEAQLVDMPKIIDLLNGMFSMIKYGLSDCSGGFGVWPGSGSCSRDGDYSRASGILNYQPAPESTVDHIVEELATLLTAGRLSEERRQYLRDTYNSFADKTKALNIIQQLIATSPEFHSTNAVASDGTGTRLPTPKRPSTGEPYKAIVYLFLSGACDSFNMLVPHTCDAVGGEPDVHAQYMDVRGEVALDKATILEIPAGSNTKFPQPCSSFGLHPMLTTLRDLYEAGDALFVANSGVMAKPVTIEDYRDETPVQLFAHNSMQRETKIVDIYDEISGTGVIGRLTDKLSRDGLLTGSFSISGNSVTLKGQPGISSATATISSSGLYPFNPNPTAGSCRDMTEMIKEMNNATALDSGFFSETWSIALNQALDQHGELYAALDGSILNTEFPTTSLGNQLKTVAKLIQTHEVRGNNREVFYISVGGYDTHSDVEIALNSRFAELNGGIDAFVKELRDKQAIWNDVVLVQYSEFARTLVPNGGAGTDHAWGGNHFILGGALDGGHVLGKYPSDLRRGNGLVLDDSRGRLVPSTPFDADWNSIAQWFGVAESDLAEVIPNKVNFESGSSLFLFEDLFGA